MRNIDEDYLSLSLSLVLSERGKKRDDRGGDDQCPYHAIRGIRRKFNEDTRAEREMVVSNGNEIIGRPYSIVSQSLDSDV